MDFKFYAVVRNLKYLDWNNKMSPIYCCHGHMTTLNFGKLVKKLFKWYKIDSRY